MIHDVPVTEIKGVGEQVAKKLAIISVKTMNDLRYYFPRRYDDYSQVEKIKQILPGAVTLKVSISQAKGRYVRRGMHITEAVASDDTGSVKLVWFNQPYREKAIKSSQEYYVSGEFALKSGRLSITNPSIELVSEFPVNTARILPIYRETKGLKSAQIRKAIKFAIIDMPDDYEILPKWLIDKHSLMSHKQAIHQMHFPADNKSLEEAKRRLGFEEIFEMTLASLLNKHELLHEHAIKIPFIEKLAKKFVSNLPFELTSAQKKVVWQIYKDIDKSQPMNRLVEGDVGSGKTVVGAMASLMVVNQGLQVALMAPTELLARQHAESLHKLLEPMGLAEGIVLLVGGQKQSHKKAIASRIKSGQAKIIVGTQALFQEKVEFNKLGLVIIDEQHRFGVDQRKKLQSKAGHALHVLNMTATPIPRSLALTLYGELDISVIDTLPLGRKPIETRIVSPNSRPQLYDKIKAQIA